MLNNLETLIALTDLVLSIEALVFAWLLLRLPKSKGRSITISLFVFLFLASLFGAAFHQFFPLKVATQGGWLVWLLVTGSLALTTISLWALAIYFAFGEWLLRPARYLAPVLFAAFMYSIMQIDYHYSTVIWFYAPALAAFCAVAIFNAWQKKRGWLFVVCGVLLSVVAAIAQTSSAVISGLDHNSLYHVLQALALFLLYLGFRKALR